MHKVCCVGLQCSISDNSPAREPDNVPLAYQTMQGIQQPCGALSLAYHEILILAQTVLQDCGRG